MNSRVVAVAILFTACTPHSPPADRSVARQALTAPTEVATFPVFPPPLNPGSYPGGAEITYGPPVIAAQLGSTVYFAATDVSHGIEFWKTDGTAAGTQLVRDIYPGTGNGVNYVGEIAAVGNRLVFSADEGHGQEAWGSDGTAAGSQLLAPGASLRPSLITPGDGGALIAATGGLWFTDGTPAGTRWLGALSSNAQASFKGQFFFSGSPSGSASGPFQLWRTDGTDAGTVVIANICPLGFCRIDQLLAGSNALYALVRSGSTGQLWLSDGTAAGTTLIYAPDAGSFPPGEGTLVGDTLFFLDPSPGGMTLARADADGGVQHLGVISGANNPMVASRYQAASGGKLFLLDDDGVHGQELWVSDGTTAGTQLVVDLWPGLDAGALWGPVAFGSGVVFTGTPDGLGAGVYLSDGTAAGTRLVANFPIDLFEMPQNYFGSGAEIFFAANGNDAGSELWKTDGLTATLVKDINPEEDRFAPEFLSGAAGTALFAAPDPSLAFHALWRSDGTPGGTKILIDSEVAGIASLGNEALIAMYPGVWRSDGTDAGTFQISLAEVTPSSFTISGNRIFFVGGVPGSGFASLYFYPSDGGVARVRDWSGGLGLLRIASTSAGVAFIDFQQNIWSSDGTDAGTQVVGSVGGFIATSPPAELAAIGDTLFLNLYDFTVGQELFKLDLTSDAGLTLVKDVFPGFQKGSSPEQLTPSGSLVFYRATDPNAGTELFRSDGTAAGTYAIDINPGPTGSNPDRFFDIGGGRVLFTADDGARRSYWVSDGTDAGTWLLSPNALPSLWLYRVSGGPIPQFPGGGVLTLPSGGFLFPAGDEAGDELWWSDGSPGSGMRLADLNPGAPSSNPGLFVATGPNVFFVASDPGGPALWAIAGLPYDGGTVTMDGGGSGGDDGGPGGPDGGRSGLDSGSNGGSDAGAASTTKGGCGCASSGPAAWALMAALLGLALTRRVRTP